VSRSIPRSRPLTPRQRLARFLATPRGVGIAGGGLITVAVLVAALLNLQIFAPGTPPAASAAPASPGTPAAFAFLAAQHSNFCQLQQTMVMSYSDSMHLQGACCNPLDMAKYQHQVIGLRAYAVNPDIAPDPYDIPVSLAKRLFNYDATITLTAAQQAVYDKAISTTDDKAPCCCKCWRWYMTRGLAKSLIAHDGMSAANVTQIIDLSNGCGGSLGSNAAPNRSGSSISP
jgi:hypothetical protein